MGLSLTWPKIRFRSFRLAFFFFLVYTLSRLSESDDRAEDSIYRPVVNKIITSKSDPERETGLSTVAPVLKSLARNGMNLHLLVPAPARIS